MKPAPRFNHQLFRETFARYAMPYSFYEIAAKTGVSAPTLSRLERGHTPSLDVYIAVCSWMGVSLDTFTEVGKSLICVECAGLRARLAQIEELARQP